MADVERLLKDFIRTRAEQGEADPRPYLEQVEGTDRRELMALIDTYLERDSTPRRRWSAEAFAGSRAEAIVGDLEERHLERPAEAPKLKELRARADLKRAEVVAKLSELLGISRGRERVAYHYHRMESGLTPADSISERALDALAGVLGAGTSDLREAMRSAQKPQAGPPTVFARTTTAAPAQYRVAEPSEEDAAVERPKGPEAEEEEAEPPSPEELEREAAEAEVDEIFLVEDPSEPGADPASSG